MTLLAKAVASTEFRRDRRLPENARMRYDDGWWVQLQGEACWRPLESFPLVLGGS